MKTLLNYLSVQLLLLWFVGSNVSAEPIQIYTVNYPLYYFTRTIAVGHANVHLPVPKDIDPAYWMPDEHTLIEYQRADLIITNGANYARWINLISLPDNRVVNTTEHISDRYIHTKDTVTHTHGPQGKHTHDNLAFTTWLDLDIANEQAGRIADALIKTLPQYAQDFENNYRSLQAQLKKLDEEMKTVAGIIGSRPLLASHPVYQYLANRYTLNTRSVHWEPEEVPPSSEWQRMEIMLEQEPAKWMLWEAPPANETVKKLTEHDITPIVFYPLAVQPDQGDFISVMQANIKRLQQALKHQ